MLLNNPLRDPESTLAKVVEIIDLCLTVIFVIEFLMKAVALGFAFNGKDSYIRNPWNIIDFIIVLI